MLKLYLSSLCLAWLSLVTASATEPILLPNGRTLEQVDFDRHVVPLLSRYGCNSGACHGSFQGRGGMRLSLFGYSPESDYQALMTRVDPVEPDDSLLLLKPSGEFDHEGGTRFEKGSWPYQVIRRWIAQDGERGARCVSGMRLKISPERVELQNGEPQPLVVLASIDDENDWEVTPFCRFTSGDEGLVTVSADGLVTSVRPGASFITVDYLGHFATVLTARPFDSSSVSHDCGSPPTPTFIDEWIDRQLRQLRLEVSPPASDEQFLRRVTLDTVGRLPTLTEMQQFAEDESPQRRQRVICCLLTDERHASLWATRLCDMTRCSAAQMEGPDDEKPKRAKMWHDWFKARIHNNVPYDEIVRGVLCGTSASAREYDQWLREEAELVRAARTGFDFDYASREFLDLYWRRIEKDGEYPRRQLAEFTSAAFLGIQIECAQCHKHPFDRWTQGDYRSFVNIFSEVHFGSSTGLNAAILQQLDERRSSGDDGAKLPLPRVQEVFNSQLLSRPLVDAQTTMPLAPRPLGGASMDDSADPRAQLMDWMLADGRGQFAENFVNRVWAHYFGRGLVEPVDGFSAMNPPTHPELLQRLAREFIESGYDIRHLETMILNTAAYQRSSELTGNNVSDAKHYARSYVRPLLAEVAVDVLHRGIGVSLDHGGQLADGAAAIDLASDQRTDTPVMKMLQTFGRGPRASVCDCDRELQPSLRKALFLMSDEWLLESIKSGELLEQVQTLEPPAAVSRLFLRLLAREPTADEFTSTLAHLQSTDHAKQAWIDVIWALVNSREFLTNR